VGWINPVFEGLSWIGGAALVWLVLALGIAALWRRPWIFGQVAVAAGAASVSARLLKLAIDRQRPSTVYARPEPLVHAPHDHSFPSGHATTSFACATTLAVLAPRLAPLFFVLAAAIAWSRVYVGVHYPLDVLAGAVLGAGIAIALRMLLAALRRSPRATRAG
jgi:undecaprenyl-diphosphatase